MAKHYPPEILLNHRKYEQTAIVIDRLSSPSANRTHKCNGRDEISVTTKQKPDSQPRNDPAESNSRDRKRQYKWTKLWQYKHIWRHRQQTYRINVTNYGFYKLKKRDCCVQKTYLFWPSTLHSEFIKERWLPSLLYILNMLGCLRNMAEQELTKHYPSAQLYQWPNAISRPSRQDWDMTGQNWTNPPLLSVIPC